MDRDRRLTLQRLGLGGAGLAAFAAGLRPSRLSAAWNQDAFDATHVRGAFDALGITEAQPTEAVVLGVSGFADNGAFVPVEITSNVPGTEIIRIFVDYNPYPFIAEFDTSMGALPFVTLRVRFAETSPLRVVVHADGRDLVATREVRVVAGGCAGDDTTPGPPKPPEAMKIRARLVGEDLDVRVLMSHPMENGLRNDAAGRLIPEHFIRNVVAELNGRTVLAARFGRSVATDPLIGFRVRGAQAGDRLTMRWEDSRGMSRSDAATVS